MPLLWYFFKVDDTLPFIYIKVYETRDSTGRLCLNTSTLLRAYCKGPRIWTLRLLKAHNLTAGLQLLWFKPKWTQYYYDWPWHREDKYTLHPGFDLREHQILRKSFFSAIIAYLFLSPEFLAFHFVGILPRNNSTKRIIKLCMSNVLFNIMALCSFKGFL